MNTPNNGASYDLTWNNYGGLPVGIFEMHKKTISNPDTIFNYVSSNLFNVSDWNTSPDSVLAYWITVPLDDACDTLRAASIRTRSNIVKRDLPTQLKELSSANSMLFDIIPNPNNGTFRLSFRNDFKNQVEVDIFSSMGISVWSSKLNGRKELQKIDLPELIQGVYLIQLNDGNKKYYKKMIINK